MVSSVPKTIVIPGITGNLIKKLDERNEKNIFSKLVSIDNFYKMKIKVLEMNRPNVKLRMTSFPKEFGVVLTYSSQIMSLQVKRTGHPITTEAPATGLDFEIFDTDGLFDPQNPNGIYFQMSGFESVELYLCYGISRQIVGKYKLNGRPTFSDKRAKFACKSSFWRSITSYDNEITGFNGSLQDLMNLCVSSATGYIDYFNSTDTNISTVTSDFENVKGKRIDLLTKCANACVSMFLEDANGVVSFNRTHPSNTYPSDIYELIDDHIAGKVKLETITDKPSGTTIYLYSGQNKTPVGYGDFVVDNDCLRLTAFTNYYANDFSWWLQNTKKYVIPYLADPTIEIGDFVKFENDYGETFCGVVAENNYSFPSSPTGDNLVVYTMENCLEA